MKLHHGKATGLKTENDSSDIDVHVNFDRETKKAYRDLKYELERIKLQNQINQQISRMLDQRFMEIKNYKRSKL